jgi:DNA polymerase/3'-5' exonuclease PolX
MKNTNSKPFSREELIDIRTRLTNLSEIEGISPTWARAYTNASDAIDRLDAMISRTTIPDCDVKLN